MRKILLRFIFYPDVFSFFAENNGYLMLNLLIVVDGGTSQKNELLRDELIYV